jgi:xanthine dehydrogenase accessory factor
MANPWSEIGRLLAGGETVTVVTVTGVRGSVPGEVGAKMVVGADGRILGTVGGGKVESKAVEVAAEMLSGGTRCVLATWNLQRDVGMTCGGEMSFLFERVAGRPEWHVVIFGAGHVAQAVVHVLANMACRIDVVEERAEWLGQLPAGRNISSHLVARFEDGVRLVRDGSMVVCMTKGHSTDRPVLREVFLGGLGVSFVGAIGSAAKRAVLLRELQEDGVGEEILQCLVCPLGLPIGGNDPAEIAVSIAAQLLERRGP